jgi:hypothetical protein
MSQNKQTKTAIIGGASVLGFIGGGLLTAISLPLIVSGVGHGLNNN